MQPDHRHLFLTPDRQHIIALTWNSPDLTLLQRLAKAFSGGPSPGSPQAKVDTGDFVAAVELLERNDVAGAKASFTRLGYTTDVSPAAANRP